VAAKRIIVDEEYPSDSLQLLFVSGDLRREGSTGTGRMYFNLAEGERDEPIHFTSTPVGE
jgi:hypothetical protein